jgi:hypothetical protein
MQHAARAARAATSPAWFRVAFDRKLLFSRVVTPRAPDAEDISIVLLGSLNPGIFHPEWFRRQEILSAQNAEEAKIKIISPEVTEILFLDMKLDVFPNRLVLETLDASRAEKLQDILLNIIAKLPHTPITACGLNNTIQFDLNDEKYWHRIGHTLAPKDLIWNDVLEKPGMALLSVKGSLPKEFAGDINVSVAPSRKFAHGLLVSSNFHYSVPRDDKGTYQSQEVPIYVQQLWKPALEKARAVAYEIFDKIKKVI